MNSIRSPFVRSSTKHHVCATSAQLFQVKREMPELCGMLDLPSGRIETRLLSSACERFARSADCVTARGMSTFTH